MPPSPVLDRGAAPAQSDEGSAYAVIAEFPDPGAVYHAAEKVRDAGFKKWDVYSSFPIHGIDKAMGLKQSKVPYFTAIGGLGMGVPAAFLMQWYMNSFDYEFITAGKPLWAWEQFMPVGFELGVLLAATMTILGMFLLNGLPRHHHPILMNERFVEGVPHDKFLIAIEVKDKQYDHAETPRMLAGLGATAVEVVHS